ncbi:hypothetical protein BDGGKGIB_01343 [Nodularia sphaerocarpa UHCC 0038]|nr:hypothetical protein BDGGKGIB_01343 [Nodularia sphaerocarpa UHCC 0038]
MERLYRGFDMITNRVHTSNQQLSKKIAVQKAVTSFGSACSKLFIEELISVRF